MMTDFQSSDTPDASSGDLITAAVAKEAGIMVYLQEELTDARLRCEQLKQFVSQAVRLVSLSAKKDHFYEVAGDILYGLPDSLFKLDKALAATALAASRLDYEELKTQLKPEKVTELETVLRNVRLRQIDRRAPFIQPNTPKMAKELEIKDLKSLQLYLEGIMTDASRGEKDASPELKSRFKDIQQQAAKALKTLKVASPQTHQGKSIMFKAASQGHVAPALRRIADGIESGEIHPRDASLRLAMVRMALSQTAQQALEAMGPLQATSRGDVIKGFKDSNPVLTEEQLNEIADQWEANKSVVKDKHAAGKLIWQDAVDAAERLLKDLKSNSIFKKDHTALIQEVQRLAGKAFNGPVDIMDAADKKAEMACYQKYEDAQTAINAEMKRQFDEFTKKQNDTGEWDGD